MRRALKTSTRLVVAAVVVVVVDVVVVVVLSASQSTELGGRGPMDGPTNQRTKPLIKLVRNKVKETSILA